ncbi:L,D-transpeptidase family protein [Streptomyces sp. 3MP-14]|uniref:L,D-transpeptidase family protein n=1 Tax=Streptomyces mimosae TaxID=2586635 RepID=A0A5N6ALY7_9ACTN|nr:MULTISPECIES: Ig-like domain-containing protein [Streptomyces]KAB8168618.1 L,D-transpeptidase family protein [Streptomyces mimosae]KAB8178102.1 L,D-transpeptidase family protein [Streptomyces sp. 3MP-14]
MTYSKILPTRTTLRCTLILAPLLAGLTACGGDARSLSDQPYDALEHLSFGGAAEGAEVNPDAPLKISARAAGARITDVVATDAAGRRLDGELAADGRSWRSSALLTAGAKYTVRVSTENGDGEPGRGEHSFRTGSSEADRVDVTFGPEPGTYGVAQPITAELSEEVTGARERALVEAALQVSSEPEVKGAWHWVDDKELHYRPRDYWPSDTRISVSSQLEGLAIADGLRGGGADPVELRTGERVEAVADIQAHTMTVYQDGEAVRTVPITTGKEGFRTRNGKKVVLGREPNVRMTGTSIGIPAGSAESYDLDVQWATRLTWSGEYVHGAPWSAASHGSANVSHGCTGMSTENAQWFFDLIKPGDIVEHVNGEGEDMAPFGNGFGDWNLSWEEWLEGSALHQQQGDDHAQPTAGRLRPSV